jgi:hypothetical protein
LATACQQKLGNIPRECDREEEKWIAYPFWRMVGGGERREEREERREKREERREKREERREKREERREKREERREKREERRDRDRDRDRQAGMYEIGDRAEEGLYVKEAVERSKGRKEKGRGKEGPVTFPI